MDGLIQAQGGKEESFTLVAGTYFDRAHRKTLKPGARVLSGVNLAKRWPRVFLRSDDPSLPSELGGTVKPQVVTLPPPPVSTREKVCLLDPVPFKLGVKNSGRGRAVLSSEGEDGRSVRLHQKTVPLSLVGFIQDHDFAALWVPPPMYKGQTVFILGGGSSLKTTAFDYGVLKGHNVIAVNDAYLKGDWPITIFGDSKWFFTHHEEYRKHLGLKVTNHPEFRGFKGVFAMRRCASHPTQPQDLPWGTTGNTGLAAIWLAAALGAAQAVLIGFDCKLGPNGESNWHPNNLTVNTRETYVYFNTAFRAAHVRMAEHYPHFKVLNAGPDSALTHWPSVKLEEVL